MYAPNTVPHILSGKAYSRAIRGHMLLESVIYDLLMLDAAVDGIDNSDDNLILTSDEYTAIQGLHTSIISSKAAPINTLQLSALQKTKRTIIEHQKNRLQGQRTAALWLQYLDMIAILRKFIKAERTGSWDQHQEAVYDVLPFFISSGHNIYAKSAWLYLQLMHDLKNTNPPVYEAFAKGLHVIRRFDRSWSGHSADLVTEQELMRSLKTAGGLTRASGMTKENRALWILSHPLCSQVSGKMELVTKTLYKSSEQHKEEGKARQQRDSSDAEALFEMFDTSSPFRGDPKLRNITNGMVTCESVNVDEAKVIGQKILDDMK